MKKKVVVTCVMGPLTYLASLGLRWQYSKYCIAKERWVQIDKILENYIPTPLNKFDNIGGSEYHLAVEEGYPLPSVDFSPFMRDEREGYFVFRLFRMNEKAVWVNLGWIPKSMKSEISSALQSQEIPVQFILK